MRERQTAESLDQTAVAELTDRSPGSGVATPGDATVPIDGGRRERDRPSSHPRQPPAMQAHGLPQAAIMRLPRASAAANDRAENFTRFLAFLGHG